MSKKTVLSASKKKSQPPKIITTQELQTILDTNKARIMPLVHRIDVLPDLLHLRSTLFAIMDLVSSDAYSAAKLFEHSYLSIKNNSVIKHKIESEIVAPLDEIESEISELEKLRTQEIYKLKVKPPKREDLDKIEEGLILIPAFEFVEDVVKYKDNSIKGKGTTPPTEEINEVFNSFARLNKLKEEAREHNTQAILDSMAGPSVIPESHMQYVNKDKVSDRFQIGGEGYSIEEGKEKIVPPFEEFEGREWLEAHTMKRDQSKKQPDFMDLSKTTGQKNITEKKQDADQRVLDRALNTAREREEKIPESKEDTKKATNLVQKWSPVLESNLGDPVVNQMQAVILANLFETQTKINKNKELWNSVDKCLSGYQQYANPLIRRYFFKLIAFDTVSMIPATSLDTVYRVCRYNELQSDFTSISRATTCDSKDISCGMLTDCYINNNMTEEQMALEDAAVQYNSDMDGELVDRMKSCATNLLIGGTPEEKLELTTENVVERLFTQARNISDATHMENGNFVICSSNVAEHIMKSTSFQHKKKAIDDVTPLDYYSCIYEIGTLSVAGINMKVFKDSRKQESYSLVGYKGIRQGHSGIQFIPYIPYHFKKNVITETGKPEIVINTKYKLVSDLPGTGSFYRYDKWEVTANTQKTTWENNSGHQIMKEIKSDNTKILIDCLKDIEILESILLSKVDHGGIATEKIKELVTPLYRHALLVLGFSVSRGLTAPSPDAPILQQSEIDMVGATATILKKLETLYTSDFMTGVVSVGRVHEILTPLKRHVNFIMGIYSIAEREKQNQKIAYTIMASLPYKGQKFSQAIECAEDGTPITTHHNIEIVNKFTADDQQSFVEFKTKFHGSGGGRIYRDQIMKYWKFIE